MFFLWVTGNLIMQYFFPEDIFKIRSYYVFPSLFVGISIAYEMITGKRIKNRADEK